MNVDFSEIFTYSNITFAIAILGALLSVYNFTKDIVQNRFKMHIAFRSYKPCPIRFNHKSFRFLMSIENRSHTALSISRILLKHQDKVYDFNCLPQRVYTWEEKNGEDVVDRMRIDSVPLPQYIPGMGVVGSYFMVEAAVDTPNDLSDWELIIMTNRGKKRYKISKLTASK
ncbi:hypothetical protein [Hominenteromicrobium sp.]|uniref:hypothetical protein n=2 Tax=Oscillospiraceae TaxID=216572 RepID=UPI003A91DB39